LATSASTISEPTVAERLAEMEKQLKPKSEAEKLRDTILETLAELGSRSIGDESIKFVGTEFRIPAMLEGRMDEAIAYLLEYKEQQETITAFSSGVMPYRPMDGAAAFDRAMMALFGTVGIGKATVSFFGKRPPQRRTIAVALNKTLQVPWGEVKFLPLEATFTLRSQTTEIGELFVVDCHAPKKYQAAIEGIFGFIREELDKRSIYRGQAIDANAEEPAFIDPYAVTKDQVVYAQDVMTQLTASLWTPIRHSRTLRSLKQSLKRCVLLHGPYGTGKTLAALLTAQEAVENGWTFILVRAGQDPFAALQTAKLYGPAVVVIEDIDQIAAAQVGGRSGISLILDALDNAQDKNRPVICMMTSNFARDIDKGLYRPGRIDAVVKVEHLDRLGFEKLIRVSLPDHLVTGLDYDRIAVACEGFLPAFMTEVIARTVMYAVARLDGRAPKVLKTEDFEGAAEGVRLQLELQNEARESSRNGPELEALFAKLIQGGVHEELRQTLVKMESENGRLVPTANGKVAVSVQ